ncbi:hypothetical protein K0M31_006631 [Melipona bicolor]|uniref:Uncharacterized protein n=1 Tax=Melipona bicolor TaxID=60889 RepID=A0AA40FRZ3_9HYME|nr:hypothetical protein K0M31_006631 [Melipona bicolor]
MNSNAGQILLGTRIFRTVTMIIWLIVVRMGLVRLVLLALQSQTHLKMKLVALVRQVHLKRKASRQELKRLHRLLVHQYHRLRHPLYQNQVHLILNLQCHLPLHLLPNQARLFLKLRHLLQPNQVHLVLNLQCHFPLDLLQRVHLLNLHNQMLHRFPIYLQRTAPRPAHKQTFQPVHLLDHQNVQEKVFSRIQTTVRNSTAAYLRKMVCKNTTLIVHLVQLGIKLFRHAITSIW